MPIKLYLKDKPLACEPLYADSGPCHHLSAQPQIPWLSGLSQRLLSHPTCSPVWWVVVAPGHLKTSQLPLSLRMLQELLKAGNASGELEQWLPAAAGKIWALSFPLPLLGPRTFYTQLHGPRPWTHSPEFSIFNTNITVSLGSLLSTYSKASLILSISGHKPIPVPPATSQPQTYHGLPCLLPGFPQHQRPPTVSPGLRTFVQPSDTRPPLWALAKRGHPPAQSKSLPATTVPHQRHRRSQGHLLPIPFCPGGSRAISNPHP